MPAERGDPLVDSETYQLKSVAASFANQAQRPAMNTRVSFPIPFLFVALIPPASAAFQSESTALQPHRDDSIITVNICLEVHPESESELIFQGHEPSVFFPKRLRAAKAKDLETVVKQQLGKGMLSRVCGLVDGTSDGTGLSGSSRHHFPEHPTQSCAALRVQASPVLTPCLCDVPTPHTTRLCGCSFGCAA